MSDLDRNLSRAVQQFDLMQACPYCAGDHNRWSCEVQNARDLAAMQQSFDEALEAAWPAMSATIAAYEAAVVAAGER